MNPRLPSEIEGPGVARRDVLRGLALAALAVAAPGTARADDPQPLPSREDLRADPERFWATVRKEQFLLGEDRVFLNPGSLGVMPRPVLKTVIEAHTRAAEYPTDEAPRWGYEILEGERGEMADFLGCSRDEIAFTHNCTEAMSTIANGLDLQPGDEVLTTNQEHGGGSACWKLRAARHGIVVRAVDIPVTPRNPDELLDRLVSAFGPKTRVLSFSGITSPTGLVLPARELCRAAREKGILSVVDGAHMDGQMPVNLRELGCDFFAGSPHKWMFAPPGCGLLYGRAELLERLWPAIVNAGWDDKTGLKSARFMMIGTNNRATIDGMIAGLRFLKRLGEDNVYARIHGLARQLVDEVRRRDYLELVTPDDARLYRAMVSIRFKKTDRLDALAAKFRERRIYVLGGPRARISVHVHTRPSDLQDFLRTCDEIVRGG